MTWGLRPRTSTHRWVYLLNAYELDRARCPKVLLNMSEHPGQVAPGSETKKQRPNNAGDSLDSNQTMGVLLSIFNRNTCGFNKMCFLLY